MASLFSCCCGLSGFGEELYKDWDNHPAAQQYTFLKRLGEGGFSEVQLAKDNLTGKTVALKIVFLNKAGLQPDERRILAGEAKLLRMVAHPNIIRCMRVLETRRQQVLVLEHLSGGEILQQLQRVRRYTEAHACQLFRQIVDAVAYLHSLGIMHRDIKPENCLLAKAVQHYKAKSKPVKVKLIDLGMAGLYRPKNPLYGCMGSPGFIAPEVVLGDAHTPAMDVYSLGVLLFVMLVGRKPWDAQRSHTLQYAIQATADAPGLADPVFAALSPTAKQLLLMMLKEEPADRPSAGDVLNHAWMLQGQKANADGSPAAAPERLIQPAVQQRLRVLGNSRQVMGTARGMMLLHSRGSRAGAVAFHKAVKEARAKLQQQAAALKAAGQLLGIDQASSAPVGTGVERELGQPAAGNQPKPSTAGGTCAAAASVSSTAAGAGASASETGGSTGTLNLARPVSYADPLSAAAAASSTANSSKAGCRSSTIGDLARQSLQHQSLLFTGPQRPPVVQAAAAAATGKVKVTAARSSSSEEPAAGTAVGVGGHFISPDAAMVAEALERGMSVPNPDIAVAFSCTDGFINRRYERAVSLSPGALALLDADDRMCLLAAGTSLDDDDSAALFSWNTRRGAADMIASFKQRYPVKPIIRSIAKFSQSLSVSRSRSLRHSAGGLGSYRSGRYSPAPTMRLGSGDMPELPVAAAAVGSVHRVITASRMQSMASAAQFSADLDQLLLSDDGAAAASEGGAIGHSAAPVTVPADQGCSEQPIDKTQQQQQQQQQQQEQQKAAAGVRRSQPAAAPASSSVAYETTAYETTASNLPATASGRTPAASRKKLPAAVTTVAVGSASVGASTELDFLGTQLSMSPLFSPTSSAATPGNRQTTEASRSLSPEAAVTPLKRPPGTAAAAAANRHFQQQQVQQRQQGQQAVMPLCAYGMHVLPAISSAASNTASSAAGTPSESLLAAAGSTHDNYSGSNFASKRRQQQQQQQQHRKQPRANPFSDSGAQAVAQAVAGSIRGQVANSSSNSGSSSSQPNMQSSNDTSNNNTSNRLPPLASGSRKVLNSPSMRAAATAAAAKDEEEGLNLPNGLWLQQSQSLGEAGGLLSPHTAIGVAGSGGLGLSMGLGLELTAARTLSSTLESPKGLLMHDSMLNVQFAEQQLSETIDHQQSSTTADGVCAASSHMKQVGHDRQPTDSTDLPVGLVAQHGTEQQQQQQQQEVGSAYEQLTKRSSSGRHTRDVSVMDWLDPAENLLAWQEPDRSRDLSVVGWLGTEGEKQALVPVSITDIPAASAESQTACDSGSKTAESGTKRPSSSRQIAVPHSMTGASRHNDVKYRRWSSSHRHSRRKRAVSSGGGADAATATSPAQAATAAEAGASITSTAELGGISIAGGATAADAAASAIEPGLGQSVGVEEQEQDFYVGSFNDMQGLAGVQQLGFGDRLGSDGLNPDDIEDMVVDELRQSAVKGWDGKAVKGWDGKAGPAVAAGAAAVAAGRSSRVLSSRVSLGKQQTSQGGFEDGDPAVLIGLEESASLDQPLASEPLAAAANAHTISPHKATARGAAAYATAASDATGGRSNKRRSHGGQQTNSSAVELTDTLSSAKLPGKLAVPSTTRGTATSCDGVRKQHPHAAVDPTVSSPDSSTRAVNGGVAWLVKSLSGKYQFPGDSAGIPARPGAAVSLAGGQSSDLRGIAAQQPAYDDFDEPTAW